MGNVQIVIEVLLISLMPFFLLLFNTALTIVKYIFNQHLIVESTHSTQLCGNNRLRILFPSRETN